MRSMKRCLHAGETFMLNDLACHRLKNPDRRQASVGADAREVAALRS